MDLICRDNECNRCLCWGWSKEANLHKLSECRLWRGHWYFECQWNNAVSIQGTWLCESLILHFPKHSRYKNLDASYGCVAVFELSITENLHLFQHNDSYSATKAEGESLVMKANGRNGLLTCCIRPSSIFGPGDRLLVPSLVAAARAGKSKVGSIYSVYLFGLVTFYAPVFVV